jgi:hypothetical protein
LQNGQKKDNFTTRKFIGMSYMNLLEKKMRYLNAFSSLNAVRNMLLQKSNHKIDSTDREIIKDAIEIAIDKTEESLSKALLYGFYNTDNTIRASALDLAKVINEAISREAVTKTDMQHIRQLMTGDADFSGDNSALISKIDRLMTLLNKAKRANTTVASNLLIKNLKA